MTHVGFSYILQHMTMSWLALLLLLSLLLLLLFILHGPARPFVAQGLSVSQVGAGQGRNDPAVPRLCQVRVDGPEQVQTCAGKAGAPEQHVSQRVYLLLASVSPGTSSRHTAGSSE